PSQISTLSLHDALPIYGFSLNNVWNSMPSGHVTVAAALSETLAADIGNTWASIGLYTCTAATVFGRLYSDQHWLSDTFLAGVIGDRKSTRLNSSHSQIS